ncbi:MAG: hypothetical protein JWL96_852 [Sphingomonas bacterium]|jgi:hypothetical protein|uniref:hypothetical protein n=1 Tax=Sphingomonas bacterium TaxID=1895847 RepID=UPI00263057A3|nr:hypothetical protein [Sphingomonas bacterium]MDB5708782.1 hypothetical protein [Sphingomonas bacterium]
MIRFALPLALLLSGCVNMQDWPKKGLTPEILLQLEQAHWGVELGQSSWKQMADFMGVPINAKAIGLRDIKCRRMDPASDELYDCKYLVDYGSNGKIEGVYERDYVTVGKDDHGIWTDGWIVVT